MFVETVEAASLALSLYEQGSFLKKMLSDIAHVLNNGRCGVVVLGPGGTGKTTLGRLLKNPTARGDNAPGSYTVSSVTEESKLKGVPLGKVHVAPGQPRRRELHWPDLVRKMGKGKIDGVIYVASWGYHSFDLEDYRQLPEYREMQKHQGAQDIPQDVFLQGYFQKKRTEEVDILRNELRPHLVASNEVSWMVTLINKQDLWWSQRVDVQRHYFEGDYNEVIDDVLRVRGTGGFEHDYLSTSLEMVNFCTANGQPLANTVGGYDQRLQYANTAKFLTRIKQLCHAPELGSATLLGTRPSHINRPRPP